MGRAPQEDIGFVFRRKWIIEHSFVIWKWQGLVNDAEHVGVMEEDVHWSLGMEADVCDGSIPLEPQLVKSLLLDRAAPLCILLVWDAELKYLLVRMSNDQVVGIGGDGQSSHWEIVSRHCAVKL